MAKRYKFSSPGDSVQVCLPTPSGTKNGPRLSDGEVFEVEHFEGLEEWIAFVNKRYPLADGECIAVAKGRPRKPRSEG